MKLGVIYNIYDGLELWEGSIDQIRKLSDFIVAVIQTVSNFGEKDRSCLDASIRLLENKKIDSVHVYSPNLSRGGTWNEIQKRNIGIDICRKQECTHYLHMDADEYYDPMQFAVSKNFIERKEYDTTCAGIYAYYKKPTYRIYPKDTYFIPFIQKIKPNSLCGEFKYPVLCDPTRIPKPYTNFYLFRESELMMHHFSHIRRDYKKKLVNSSAKINWNSAEKISKLVEAYEKFELGDKLPFHPLHSITEVPNRFNIHL